MKRIIYIRLLNEGTTVFRPVPASEIHHNIYEINGSEIHDPEDEQWEFLPGTIVLVEEKYIGGQNVLVAIEEHKLN